LISQLHTQLTEANPNAGIDLEWKIVKTNPGEHRYIKQARLLQAPGPAYQGSE
jgi:hypothetical protein